MQQHASAIPDGIPAEFEESDADEEVDRKANRGIARSERAGVEELGAQKPEWTCGP